MKTQSNLLKILCISLICGCGLTRSGATAHSTDNKSDGLLAVNGDLGGTQEFDAIQAESDINNTDVNETIVSKCISLWTSTGPGSMLASGTIGLGVGTKIAARSCGFRIKYEPDGTSSEVPGFGYVECSPTGAVKEVVHKNYRGRFLRCPDYSNGHRLVWFNTMSEARTPGGVIGMKFDLGGSVANTQKLPPYIQFGLGLHMRDDGYLVGLGMQFQPTGKRESRLLTGSTTLTSMKEKTGLGNLIGVGMEDSLLAPDGGLYCHGRIEQGNTSKATRVIRITPKGTLMWSTPVDANGQWGFRTLAAAHNTGIVVAGTECDCPYSSEVDHFGERSISFEEVNPQGKLIRKRSLAGPKGTTTSVYSIAKNNTGYMLLTPVVSAAGVGGSARLWQANEIRTLLWQLDPSGNILWNRYVHTSNNNTYAFVPDKWDELINSGPSRQSLRRDTITGAIPTPDGHIILAGRVPDASNITLSHAWFRRLGPHGEQDCDKKDLCIGVKTTIDCDDGDPCTTDVCQPDKGCVHLPRPVMSWCGGDLTTNYKYDCEPCDFGPTYKACQLPEGKSSGKLECSWVPYKLIAAPGKGTEGCKPMCPSDNDW